MTKANLPVVDELRVALATKYRREIENYFGDPKKALKFLSGVMTAVQKTPKLLECEPTSVINSFMTMAQLEFMPSDVSGEAYVLPYGKVAQFQLGYQGLVTLFYRAGAKSIVAEIVRKNDKFDYTNGVITHSPDVFGADRGEAIGAYVIVTTKNDGQIAKVMNKKDILAFGTKFSKSYFTFNKKTKKKELSEFSPWNPKNDPELTMWKKTVLKQVAKLVPKNEALNVAVAEDNKDSIISDRMAKAKEEAKSLKMGNLIKTPKNENKDETKNDVA